MNVIESGRVCTVLSSLVSFCLLMEFQWKLVSFFESNKRTVSHDDHELYHRFYSSLSSWKRRGYIDVENVILLS